LVKNKYLYDDIAVRSTNRDPWMQTNVPGLIRAIAAIIFPFGLCLIV
jgi:hypothetical protein